MCVYNDSTQFCTCWQESSKDMSVSLYGNIIEAFDNNNNKNNINNTENN